MDFRFNTALILLLSILIGGSLVFAEFPQKPDNIPLHKPTVGTPKHTMSNISNMSSWISANGMSAHNPNTDDSGLIYPRLTANSVFQDGIIWGGYVSDGQQPKLRVGGQTYRIGTVEGAILAPGVAEDPNAPDVRIWRARRDYATADLSLEAQELGLTQQQIRQQYATDWVEWPWQKGAPFYDINGDGIYDPAVDEPGIANADQVVWTVANDLDASKTLNLYGSRPIGLEMQITLWGYNQGNTPLGQAIFKRVRIIYEGTSNTPPNATIDSMFIAQWSDPDIGDFTNDFAGCDVYRQMGFAYNGQLVDNQYAQFGLPPAALGYDLLQGPILYTGNPGDSAIFNMKAISGHINLPMTSFSYFSSGSPISDPILGDYTGTLQWYNMLNGFTPTADTLNPTPYVHRAGPNAGQPTKFPLDGDPLRLTGDIDGIGSNFPPGDRRIVLSSGPFSMSVGDTQEMVFALVGGIIPQPGGNHRNAVEQMKLNSDNVQFIHNHLYQGIPNPPPAPIVSASPLDKKIVLTWGSESEVNDTTFGYDFEGYNVYMSSSQTGPWKKIATYDLVNFVTIIRAYRFDPVYGDIILVPIQQGTDSGIQHFIEITQDPFDNPLVNGQTYYFAVTAYNYNDDPSVPEPSLENSIIPIETTPVGPLSGFDYGSAGLDSTVIHVVGNSTADIIVDVIDPAQLTGHTYRITFELNPDSVLVWNLIDVDDNTTVLAQQTDFSGSLATPIVDGILVRITNPPPGIKPRDMFDTNDQSQWGWSIPSGTRRFTWANASGFQFEGFRGAIGWASPHYVFGGGPPGVPADQLKKVLLMLAQVTDTVNYNPTFDQSGADPNVSFGYRYGRGFAGPPARPEFAPYIINPGGGYAYQDFTRSVPLSAWDIEDPNNPRRLVVGFLENNVEGDPNLPVNIAGGGLVDGKWWPGNFNYFDNTAGGGPREWLWIFDADYSETPNPAFEVEAISNPLPIMYWLTVNRRGPVPFSPNQSGEDQFMIIPNRPLTVNDIYEFTTVPPPAFTIMKGDVNEDSLVNVADVVKLINFILEIDTLSPAQQYAADFNLDLRINVADAVAIINSILGLQPPAKTTEEQIVEIGFPEKVGIEEGIISVPLQVNTKHSIAGLQMEVEYDATRLKPLLPKVNPENWKGISIIHHSKESGKAVYLFYSLQGRPLPATESPSLQFEFIEEDENANVQIKLLEAIPAGSDGNMMRVNLNNQVATSGVVPASYALHQNYPNPFNAETIIMYDLPVQSRVSIQIYNVLGQKVRTLLDDKMMESGRHRVQWDAHNDHGQQLASGIYFIRFRAEKFITHRKMVLVK